MIDNVVKVTVIHPNGGTRAIAKLPTMVAVSKLAKGLAVSMDLPTVSPKGYPIDYRLSYQNGREVELGPTQTLYEAGIKEESTLKLRSEMQAGCE